jgi:hypothetical protein
MGFAITFMPGPGVRRFRVTVLQSDARANAGGDSRFIVNFRAVQ